MLALGTRSIIGKTRAKQDERARSSKDDHTKRNSNSIINNNNNSDHKDSISIKPINPAGVQTLCPAIMANYLSNDHDGSYCELNNQRMASLADRLSGGHQEMAASGRRPAVRGESSSSSSSSRIPNIAQKITTTARRPRSALVFIATTCLLATTLTLLSQTAVQAASNRFNMHPVSRQTNQYFLNEFCDLESKTLRSAKKLKQASDTHSLFLTSKNTLSSVRVLPQKQQMPSSISFGFGSSQQANPAPIYKQLNCSIIVVAPKSHGLLVTVNSIGLPKNLTKLGITLNHDSAHAQQIHLEGETKSANYLLTQPQSSKIAINLQSFQPIDWSHVSFDILFTVYKKANSTGGCPNKKWFDCGDNICVPSSLVCDNNRNCPNGNDEMIFYRCYSPLFWSIAASSLLALFLVAIMVVVIMIVRRQRQRRGLTKLNSFSHNQLAADSDLLQEHSSSKLDLTQANTMHQQNYLASNMYLGGFENPVWTNGTLSKQQQQQQPQQPQLQQQQQQPPQ